jgi:hypothetical protein
MIERWEEKESPFFLINECYKGKAWPSSNYVFTEFKDLLVSILLRQNLSTLENNN